MLTIKRTVLLGFVLLAGYCSGQHAVEARLRKADRAFDKLAYTEALRVYERLAAQGVRSQHVVSRLADCNLLTGHLAAAEPWSTEAMRFLNVSVADRARHARILLGVGRPDEAAMVMELADRSSEPMVSGLGSASDRLRAMGSRFEVMDAGVNTAGPELAPCWSGNGRVIFAAPAEEGWPIHQLDAWTGLAPFDLFIAERLGDDRLVGRRPLSGTVNGRFHEASVASDPRSLDLVFARTAPPSKEGLRSLRLEHAIYRGDHWDDQGPWHPDVFGEAFHPALSVDGRTLYFASDRPGGAGGTDIYMSRLDNDRWTTPEPLGAPVNTPGNELFPFVDEHGALYFSSNGHPGLGGYDVFRSAWRPGSGFDEPVNLGTPLNGPADETGFIIDRSGRHGYFASDRPGGHGGDDLYAFTLRGAIEPVPFACAGVVRDGATGQRQRDLAVDLLDEAGEVVATDRTDESGRYAFDIERGRSYRLRVTRTDGATDETALMPGDVKDERVVTRDLELLPAGASWIGGMCMTTQDRRSAAGARVTLVGITGMDVQYATTGPDGRFRFHAQPRERYTVFAELPGHYSVAIEVSTGAEGSGPMFLAAASALMFEPVMTDAPIALEEVGIDGVTGALVLGGEGLKQLAERLVLNPQFKVELIATLDEGWHDELRARSCLETMLRTMVGHGVASDRMRIKVERSSADNGAVLAADADLRPQAPTRFSYLLTHRPMDDR
jgi:hypothetical protein